MDPINIIVGLNILATFGANMSGAKKGLRSTVSAYKEKPKTYLQDLPVWLSVVTIVLLVLGLFQIGTFPYIPKNFSIRVSGLILYLIFSWFQVWAYKTLGENYSQQIIIFRDHQLVTKGPYRFIRHPQYISQFVIDVCGGIAVLSYLLIPIAIIELPVLILRAAYEDRLLAKNFKESFIQYKKRTGFVIPFIG